MAEEGAPAYAGGMKDQRRDGYGLYVYPNSFFKYEGQWKSGKKHGHGKLLFKDGSYYEGEFADGEIIGHGLRYWASTGNIYSGQFLFGELHGHGILHYGDGGKYEGEFSYGVREGYGSLTGKDGQLYQGSFYNNKKHGGGKMTFPNGEEFEGDWILDQKQGHGVLQCPDGTLYEGQWRNDMFNGQGCLIHCSGVTYDGLWHNGSPVGQSKKMVISGPEVIIIGQGSAFTLHVQLQTEEGEISQNERGRLLEITAKGKKRQFSASCKTSSESLDLTGKQPIQNSFVFGGNSYPLKVAMSGSQQLQDAPPTVSQSGPPVPEVPTPRDGDPESGSKAKLPDSTGDALSKRDGSDACGFPGMQRSQRGWAIFKNITLASLLTDLHPDACSEALSKRQVEKQRVKASEEEREEVRGSRTRMAANGQKSRRNKNLLDVTAPPPGEYVIMVREVTSPPFLGQLLPPVFKLLRVMPEKGLAMGSGKEIQNDLGS